MFLTLVNKTQILYESFGPIPGFSQINVLIKRMKIKVNDALNFCSLKVKYFIFSFYKLDDFNFRLKKYTKTFDQS